MSKEKKGIKLDGISKIYIDPKTKKDFYAVNKVSLDIEPGSFVTLLGPSGCGKTTTLRMIAGFESPDEGGIWLGGEKIDELTPDKRDTAMVFQSYALLPHYNIFDNVAYGLKLRKVPRAEIEKRVAAILELVELSGMESRMTNQLSGGQQQRVALARAMVVEPSVLLFDEPLSNLDAKLRVSMRTEIRRIQQTLGITAVYVTHDQAEAMAISDDIIVMNAGHVQQQGDPMAIYTQPANVFMAQFIGHHNLLTGDQLLALGCHHTRTQAVRAAHHYIVRPELFFREEPQNAGPVVAIAGHLISATMLGDRIRYRFATAVDQLTLTVERLNHTTPLALNQPLTLYLREHDVQEVGPHA